MFLLFIKSTFVSFLIFPKRFFFFLIFCCSLKGILSHILLLAIVVQLKDIGFTYINFYILLFNRMLIIWICFITFPYIFRILSNHLQGDIVFLLLLHFGQYFCFVLNKWGNRHLCLVLELSVTTFVFWMYVCVLVWVLIPLNIIRKVGLNCVKGLLSNCDFSPQN